MKKISLIIVPVLFIGGCASIFTSPFTSYSENFSTKEELLTAKILTGALAIARAEYKLAAESFEIVTRDYFDENYLLQCIDAAIETRNYEIANKCYGRLKEQSELEQTQNNTPTPSLTTPSANPTQQTKLNITPNQLDAIAATIIATIYPGDYVQKFSELLSKFNDETKKNIAIKTSRDIVKLREYQRGANIFAELSKDEKNINFATYAVLYADYLRMTWQDLPCLIWAEKAFNAEKTPLTLIMLAEALHLNGQLPQALILLKSFQNQANFVDVAFRTSLEKVNSQNDENLMREFLTKSENEGVLTREISTHTKLTFVSYWFEFFEYKKAQTILNSFEREVVASRNPDLISLYIYLKGVTDLELARNTADADSAQKLLNRILANPRFNRMITIHQFRTQIEKEGIEPFINQVRAKANIIMSPDDYLSYSRVLNQKNRTDVALEVLENGLKFHNEDTAMLYDAAMNALKLSQEEKMEKYLQKVIEVDDSNYNAFNALGYTWADQNRNLEEAKKNIENALSHKPLEPIILDSYGWYFYRAGEMAKAYEFLNRALTLQHDPEICAHLIEVLIVQARQKLTKGNEFEQAKTLYNDAMRRYQQYPTRDASIRALEIMQKLTQKYPQLITS